MADGNVVDLGARRETKDTQVAIAHVEPPQWPAGPFTVAIADNNGKLFEVTFPDYSGELAPDAAILGTAGIPNVDRLVVNLLAGALRAFAGAV